MRKIKVGLYCYVTAGILTELFYKCLLSSPAPSIKKLYKFLIMPLTSKKLTGHNGFGSSVRASMRASIRNMHAISYEPCLLGFWNLYMDSSWKNSWPVLFFLSELSPFLELRPFEKIRMKSCHQDIKKSTWARGLKLCQLTRDDE